MLAPNPSRRKQPEAVKLRMFPRCQAVLFSTANRLLVSRWSRTHFKHEPHASFLGISGAVLGGMLAMSMERECYADERSPQYSSKKPPHAVLYSDESQDVEKELQRLQRHFLSSLDKISVGKVEPGWQAISWERDGGEHGGGNRYQKLNTPLFQNASVN